MWRLALDLEVLVVDVERLGGIADQHVVGLPVAQEGGGAGVAVLAVAVAGLLLVEDEADDVVGAAVVEGLLQRGVDDVVGRGDHVAEGADAAQVVAVSAERADVGHEFILSDSGGRLYGPSQGSYLRAGDNQRRAGGVSPRRKGRFVDRADTAIDAGGTAWCTGGAVMRRLPHEPAVRAAT